MKTTRRTIIVASGLAMLLASCGPDAPATARVPMSATKADPSLTGRLQSTVNSYRQSIGREAIPRNASLDRMAREHCEYMARNRGKFERGTSNITHEGFEERAFFAQRRLGMSSIAENVAGGRFQGDIAEEVTKAWIESSGHRFNLKQKWNATGLGVFVTDDGMVYATQIFAVQGNSQMEMVDRFRQF